MTWLIGVPLSMILGIVALYATLRQAPVPRTAGDSTLAYDALRTIMPIVGWPEERAREVEISVGADQVLPTRFRIGPAGAALRGPSDPRAGQHTSIIEPLSLDEAYLDVTENLKAISSAAQIAEEIRARIRAETELSFGRRLLQQVHGMTPDILFVRFGSRRSPCRRNPPWARRRRSRTKVRASPSSRCFPSHPPQGWQ
jgi:hypothetical protein